VVTTDARVEKTFFLTERWKLDLRGKFYNLLNHAIFNVPGFTFGAADFGVVSSARSPRAAQLAARLSFDCVPHGLTAISRRTSRRSITAHSCMFVDPDESAPAQRFLTNQSGPRRRIALMLRFQNHAG
jgi:hypothetical protein